MAWVNAGAPKGNDADLPPRRGLRKAGCIRKGLPPDLVISLPGEFQAPASGEIPYVRYLAKVPLSEDKWIAASPGSSRQSRAGAPHGDHGGGAGRA